MPLHDWTRVRSGIYHNFHVLWLSSITNRLNAGLLPKGLIAMTEQVVGGPESDVVALELDGFDFLDDRGSEATTVSTDVMIAVPPKPQTSFVIPVESERYATKANRVVIRHSLGRVLAVIELVSPGNKDSQHALRSFVEKTVNLIFDNINVLVVDPFPPSARDPQGIHKAIWDEVAELPFELPTDRNRTLVSYQTRPVKTAYVEPMAVGSPLPDMPLFLHNDFYINVPLESTYQDTWNVLPQPLKDLVM